MHQLPKITGAQQIGQAAADIFSAVFAQFCNVVPVPQEHDLGIDFICEIIHRGHPTGKHFNVQCKGKEAINIGSDTVQVAIKVETLNYWLLQGNPTFLIVVDCQSYLFYWSFPEAFLNELKNKDWQAQKTVSIPVPKENSFDLKITELPFDLIAEICAYVPSKLKQGESFEFLAPIFEKSNSRENMSIKELMRYYLEGSRIANAECSYAQLGLTMTVYPETFGGKRYRKGVQAKAWGELREELGILLQLPGENNYILSHKTFREICLLLNSDIPGCEVISTHTPQGGEPGSQIRLKSEAKSFIATAWYEIPPGNLKIFKSNNIWYAISLRAKKTISTNRIERRSGSYLSLDPRHEIVWHYFDLSKYDYSLPLKLNEA